MSAAGVPCPPERVRVRLDLGYDGAPFSGWARQPGLPTVQGCLEEALELIFREPIHVTVAGRTDAGVHARGQVAHVDVPAARWYGWGSDPQTVGLRRLQGALRRAVGRAASDAIVVHAFTRAPEGFDARFSALYRRYSYRIADQPSSWDPLQRSHTWWFRKPLSSDLLNEAAAPLLGLHDFFSFSRLRPGATTIRQLQRCEFSRETDGVLIATVQADAFCHGMVRGLIGALVRVGSGECPREWICERLDSGERQGRYFAPAHPLILEEVDYPSAPQQLAVRAQQTRAHRSLKECTDSGQ